MKVQDKTRRAHVTLLRPPSSEATTQNTSMANGRFPIHNGEKRDDIEQLLVPPNRVGGPRVKSETS
jgi:hypothetical protein